MCEDAGAFKKQVLLFCLNYVLPNYLNAGTVYMRVSLQAVNFAGSHCKRYFHALIFKLTKQQVSS